MMRIFLGIMCLAPFQIYSLEYQLQFENDQVSVARAKILPHEEIGLHRDVYPHIVVALKGGTITRLEPDGRTVDVIFPTGVGVYRPTDPEDQLHRSVNHSDEEIELIIIQLKDK